jgi:ParB family chromosome partitioning protein
VIGIDLIDPNPNQPRSYFDEEALEALAASITEVGILQPLVVRPKRGASELGRYELVAGERRWRAAQKVGLSEVPAVIRAEEHSWSGLTEALVENIQREDLGVLEEAAAYSQLLEDFGWTHDDLAAKVGKARPTITNRLRLLGLPASIQGLLERGEISPAHAKELAGMEDQAYAEHIARRAADEGWSVRMVRDALAARGSVVPVVTARRTGRPAEIIAYEERLGELLGSPVKIAYSGSRGTIKVKFSSMEELDNIYQAIDSQPG